MLAQGNCIMQSEGQLHRDNVTKHCVRLPFSVSIMITTHSTHHTSHCQALQAGHQPKSISLSLSYTVLEMQKSKLCSECISGASIFFFFKIRLSHYPFSHSESHLSSWLYLARRSDRQGAPVLIWKGNQKVGQELEQK